MSDADEKPFAPTPSRVAKAKREGNLPHAPEFAANAAFACSAAAVCAIGAPFGALCAASMREAASGHLALAGCVSLMVLAACPVLAASIGGVGGAIVQHGGLHVSGVSIRFDRLNPIEGLKRMGSRDTIAHAARAAVAFALAVAALFPAVRAVLAASAAGSRVSATASAAWSGAQHVVFVALAVASVFALVEFSVARTAWMKKLRMTFAEYKRELKEQDGDATMRGRRRSLHRSFVRGSLARVKDASFVVVNPTHVAVALEYRPPRVPVPTVLVRAADDGALRVRELAARHRVPVIEDVPLARALFADARVGEPIAQVHYVAVAEIVAALQPTRESDS